MTGFEPGLLAAMLGYVRQYAPDAVAVLAYKERSYNIGYCETCWDIVTEVRMYYVRRDGSPGQYEYLGDLGEFIRGLTVEPATQEAWESTAVRQTEEEREARLWGDVHSFDEEPAE